MISGENSDQKGKALLVSNYLESLPELAKHQSA